MRWLNWRRGIALIAMVVGIGVGASTTPASASVGVRVGASTTPVSAAVLTHGVTIETGDWWW